MTLCFQVALKFLRQIMVQNVREKLLKVYHLSALFFTLSLSVNL